MADGVSFPTLKRKLVLEKHSFLDSKERFKNRIDDHTFNVSVELLLAECSLEKFEEYFKHSSPTLDHYCIVEVPVHVFTDVLFIDSFIKHGKFSALSLGTHVDTNNCIAVLPSGVLILALDKDTYEQLGLQGKNSANHKKHRFSVEVDLKSASFVPGKKHYDRVRWCLKDRLDLKFKFFISWIQQDGSDGSKKVDSYFKEYGCQVYNNVMEAELLTKLKAPRVEFTCGVTEEKNKIFTESCDAEAFFDWLGCTACGIDCSSASSDDYLSSMCCPEPHHQLKEVVKCRWSGFIPSYRINELLQSARKLISSCDVKAPWFALTVWGFVDSPVTWKNTENGYQFGGENIYTFVIFPDQRYWLYMALGSHGVLR